MVRDANTRNRILGRSARLDLKRTDHGHLLDAGMDGHGAIHVATRAEVLLFIDGCSWGAENQHRWSEIEVRECAGDGDPSWSVVEACQAMPGTGTVYATYRRREWAHALHGGHRAVEAHPVGRRPRHKYPRDGAGAADEGQGLRNREFSGKGIGAGGSPRNGRERPCQRLP